MLNHELICKTIRAIAPEYSLKKVSYFGSYATGTPTPNSDLDILVEFNTQGVSLLLLADLKYRLEDALKVSVDIIHAPLPRDTLLEVGRVVPVYGA